HWHVLHPGVAQWVARQSRKGQSEAGWAWGHPGPVPGSAGPHQRFAHPPSATGSATPPAGPWAKPRHPSAHSNGSVTAGEDLGGVRPSSGAAMMESEEDAMKSGASAYSVLAAPEDGRTPIASHPPSLTHYRTYYCRLANGARK